MFVCPLHLSTSTVLVIPALAIKRRNYQIFFLWLIWVLISRIIKLCFYLWEKPLRIFYMPMFIVWQYVAAFIKIYAMFTCFNRTWGTRDVTVKNGEVVRTKGGAAEAAALQAKNKKDGDENSDGTDSDSDGEASDTDTGRDGNAYSKMEPYVEPGNSIATDSSKMLQRPPLLARAVSRFDQEFSSRSLFTEAGSEYQMEAEQPIPESSILRDVYGRRAGVPPNDALEKAEAEE